MISHSRLNSLVPRLPECDFENAIFNIVSVTRIFKSYHQNALRWLQRGHTDDKSTLAQVITWCRQGTAHYLSRRWRRFMSSYGIIMPKWMNELQRRYTQTTIEVYTWMVYHVLICFFNLRYNISAKNTAWILKQKCTCIPSNLLNGRGPP